MDGDGDRATTNAKGSELMAMIQQPTPKRERGMVSIGEILAELLPVLDAEHREGKGK